MKLDLSNKAEQLKARSYLDRLIELESKIEIKKHVKKRTNPQNRYFHVACTILSEYSGYTVAEMKLIIKDRLDFMNYDKGGHHFYRSSADLDKLEFIDLVDHIRDFGQDNGCYIPTPEEYYTNEFEVEKELRI